MVYCKASHTKTLKKLPFASFLGKMIFSGDEALKKVKTLFNPNNVIIFHDLSMDIKVLDLDRSILSRAYLIADTGFSLHAKTILQGEKKAST